MSPNTDPVSTHVQTFAQTTPGRRGLTRKVGRNVDVAAPFGLRDDVWLLLLSLPLIFYSSRIFFDGAVRALRARTLAMMVLVSVAIGTGWLSSVAVTLTGGGDTFYEAVSVLAAFVLLGHPFEMRARGGRTMPSGP